MKKQLLIMNGPETFRNSSCCNNTPRIVEWIHTTTIPPNNQPIVLFDYCIQAARFNQSNTNIYGWLGESSEIIQPLIEHIFSNIEEYKDKIKKIFTNDKRLINADSEFFEYCPNASNLSWIVDRGVHTKTELCSYITSTKGETTGHRLRLGVLEHLKQNNILNGHVFGRGHNEIQNKEQALNNYMFSIVIENGNYPKYYTEKVMDAFTTGTIPLYVGTKMLSEDFDERGIIFLQDKPGDPIDLSILDTLTPELYNSMLPYVQKNYSTACNMEMSDDYICRRIFEDD